MKYYCNPINVNYRYQFNADPRRHGKLQICREAADPSMICFQGRYYIFASMTLGVWVSDDLVNWENHRLPAELPLYDYAPDVRVLGGWVYFCASSREHNCDRWRTKDILNGPYEKLEGSFPFWDPNLFADDDGRVYFYWGCSNQTPIYGVELDPDTLQPIGEKRELIFGDPYAIGYERIGENNSTLPASDEEVEARYRAFVANGPVPEDKLPPEVKPLIRGMFTKRPYIEGAWMDKHCGRYYFQYAAPGTQYNTYSDGVYVGEGPLGPFRLAANNPYSYKPGGFLPGAGHGSTMQDEQGNFWHTATMRISVNHDFERRVGLWPAGFDADGELYCNQRYGDWPMAVSGFRQDAWRGPKWMLLSVHKTASASSFVPGHEPDKAIEENVQTWWRASSSDRGEWLCADLGKVYDVHAVQVNFADDAIDVPCPGEIRPGSQARYIEEADHVTRWKLEGSADGERWFLIEDKSAAATDLSHDLVVREEGFAARYLRLSELAVPYGQNPCISGVRVFGLGSGEKPAAPRFTAVRSGDLDMRVEIAPQDDALGYSILFGSSPEKLYHSDMVFASGKHRVGALIRGREYYVRVDAFNENGITEGVCVKLKERSMAFSKEFLIGAATAAHQVEGNNTNSDYWAQEQLPHTSFAEPSGIACDHYNRYEDDIRLLADAGLNAYRFSIEWARIEPEEGCFDDREIEHYRKVIACCRAHGVEPIVTLHHFTSPVWLIRKGGWEAESTVDDFRRYASYVTEKLGGELKYICTINEANMGLQLAAIARRFTLMAQQAAKNAKSAEGTVQVGMNFEKMMENMKYAAAENAQVFGTPQPQIFVSSRTTEGDKLVFRAHQAAKAAIKALYPDIRVGITLSMHDCQALPGGERFAEAAWDEEFRHYLPYIAEDDFLGVQNYTRTQYGPEGQLPAPEGAELTQMDYEFYPEALEHVIRRVREDFKGDLIVTENGVAVSDDSRRIEFIRRALRGVESCLADGIPVKGYCYWSLMDNFEWQKGFSMTFGLIAVDRATMERTPKESLALLGGCRG